MLMPMSPLPTASGTIDIGPALRPRPPCSGGGACLVHQTMPATTSRMTMDVRTKRRPDRDFEGCEEPGEAASCKFLIGWFINLPSDVSGLFRNLVAGTTLRVRWQPYLTVPACGCRINNRKELHFWFKPRLRGNNQDFIRAPSRGSRATAGERAQTVHFYLIRGRRQGRSPGPTRRAGGQAAPSRRRQSLLTSGGCIQQAERASHQGLASFVGERRRAVVDGHKAKRDQAVERPSARDRQSRKRRAKSFQRFPLVGSEIEIVLVTHAASIGRQLMIHSTCVALYVRRVNRMRPQCVENWFARATFLESLYVLS